MIILKVILHKKTRGYEANLRRSLQCSLVGSSRHGTKSLCSTNDEDFLGSLRVRWVRKKYSIGHSGITGLTLSFQTIRLIRLCLCFLSIKWTALEDISHNMTLENDNKFSVLDSHLLLTLTLLTWRIW